MTIVYEDDDIIVVDSRPASPPIPRRAGPADRAAGVLAAGHTIATSGAAERQGIVHRLDANTTGLMVVAKSEAASQPAQAGLPRPRGQQDLPRAGQGHPTRCAARSTRRSPGTRRATAGSRCGRRPPSVTHYDTVEAFGRRA